MSKNYIKDTFEVLIASETLKRLLWYKPRDNDNPDPLSPTLPNISDDGTLNWQVIEDRILLNSKSDDLVDEPKCRLYLYLGGRNRTNNPLFEKQEIIIDILWNELFDNDSRLTSILRCLDSLVIDKKITGIGKTLYKDGFPISAPKNYQGYRYIIECWSTKK